MKIFDEIGVFIAEDGAKFFSYAEAKSHEELAYVGKTLSAFGHTEVTAALNEVERAYPEVRDALSFLVAHLTYRQAASVAEEGFRKIESYLAPEAVRAPGTEAPEDGHWPADITVSPPASPKSEEKPQEPPPPPSEPERVRKPDTRPRPSDPAPSPASALDTPADRPPLTRNDLSDAVPPYMPPAAPLTVPQTPAPAPEVAADPAPFPGAASPPSVADAATAEVPGNGSPDPIAAMKGIADMAEEKAANGS